MSDLALIWSAELGCADLALSGDDFVSDEGLRTAVELSLFTDRRAEPGDVLPDGETDRRGCWADAVADVDGDRMGSRLWLLARAKNTPDVLSRAEEYAREALAWLLADKVASSVTVVAEFLAVGDRGVPALGLTVTIQRPSGSPAVFKFGRVWAAEEAA